MPTRGTTNCVSQMRERGVFQSTCPRGARRHAGYTHRRVSFQSTCPRGARPSRLKSGFLGLNFNPRAHEGHDSQCRYFPVFFGFQSTCPRGARHLKSPLFPVEVYFNPRAHEGHDGTVASVAMSDCISIHVPTRGTTHQGEQKWIVYPISIHVPTRGTTCFVSFSYSFSPISIHVPTRGTTDKEPVSDV